MSTAQILAIVWIPVSVALVIIFAFSVGWIEAKLGLDRLFRPPK